MHHLKEVTLGGANIKKNYYRTLMVSLISTEWIMLSFI